MSDLSYKFSQDKHLKYYDFYKNSNLKDNEYWGLGIENESYLMFENLVKVDKNFILNNQKIYSFTFLPPLVSVDEGAAATSPIPPPLPLRVSNGNESANTIS